MTTSAIALHATGTNNALANNGTVTTSGVDARGLYHDGANGTLSNIGSVTTSGTTIYTTDITGFAAAGAAAAARGSQVLDALAHRGTGIGVTRGAAGGQRWVQAIGGAVIDPGSSTTAAWWGVTAGAVMGPTGLTGRAHLPA